VVESKSRLHGKRPKITHVTLTHGHLHLGV
jgi:hypothetical protein